MGTLRVADLIIRMNRHYAVATDLARTPDMRIRAMRQVERLSAKIAAEWA